MNVVENRVVYLYTTPEELRFIADYLENRYKTVEIGDRVPAYTICSDLGQPGVNIVLDINNYPPTKE